MTHSQEQNSGWIEHDGKGIPDKLDGATEVFVRFRDGEIASPETASYWSDDHQGPDFWCWLDADSGSDIVAYKVHTPSPSSQGDEQ